MGVAVASDLTPEATGGSVEGKRHCIPFAIKHPGGQRLPSDSTQSIADDKGKLAVVDREHEAALRCGIRLCGQHLAKAEEKRRPDEGAEGEGAFLASGEGVGTLRCAAHAGATRLISFPVLEKEAKYANPC
jgi:hypothetical protein